MFSIQGLGATNCLKTTATIEPVQVFVKVDRKDNDPFEELANPTEKIKEEAVELDGNVHSMWLSRCKK